MSIPSPSREALARALTDAHALIEMGVPVFAGRLNRDGDPDRLDPRWKSWQASPLDHTKVDKYRPGEALCAVTGINFDVLDYDPRNGGDFSLRRLDRELGDEGPEKYWEVETPSGGRHLWIAPLGIGSHPGFLPGLDLKGGLPDGTSRGFVFIPPTIRPSKNPEHLGKRLPYLPKMDLIDPEGDGNVDALIEYIHDLQARKGKDEKGNGRIASSSLRQACLEAGPGDQRPALLAYTHELERKGYDNDDIIRLLREVAQAMPAYEQRNPWYPARGRNPDSHLIGLLHKSGEVLPDALPGELDGIEDGPIAGGLIRWASELEQKTVQWLWEAVLAFRELTILDGEKGMGKTFVTDDVVARATLGRAMPGCAEASCGPINVIIFTDEGHAESVLKPRLVAAGANLTRVAFPAPRKPKKGKRLSEWDDLGLPGGAVRMGQMIREASAQLAIWDPITDFLAEDIQSHNDASVRRALHPLATEVGKVGCCGWMLRHMNKDTKAAAKYRGSGSTAFQNRARVHLISARMPDSYHGPADFGIAVVDTNLTVKRQETLAYSIVDSDVPMDEQGNMVGKVEWHDWVLLEGNPLVEGEARRRGPAPTVQPLLEEKLRELFDERETWPARKIRQILTDEGFSTDNKTLDKVRSKLGIRSVRIHRPGQVGAVGWAWTMSKHKVHEDDL